MTAERKRRQAPVDDAATLPHNLDAERSVLGAVLVNNTAFARVASILSPESFFRDAHQRIFRAMRELDARRVIIDPITLREELDRAGDLSEVGGVAYLAALTDGMPYSANVVYYAGIVNEKATLRHIITAASTALRDAYHAEDPAHDILVRADRAFLDLHRTDRGDRVQHLSDATTELFQDIEWRVSHRGELTGVDTGFRELNAETFGWQAGDMIVIAARPSIGKTALVLNMAAACGRQGKRTLIFSLEMRRKQLEYRLLSSLANVPLSRILGGTLGAQDYQHISQAFEAMNTLPITIDDRADHTVQDIRMACRRLRAERQLDLVIVDYVQLIPGSLDRRGATRTEELADISRRLKRMADELAVPVIVLSQLKRIEGRPRLDDLRECGALEQDCDVALLLHRKNHREGGVTEAILAKQRNGPTGTVLLSFDRDTVTFTDAPEGSEAPAADEERRPSTRRKYAMATKRRQRNDENPRLQTEAD